MELPDMLASRIEACLADATPAALARTDQLAGMWRDFFTQRGLDLTDQQINGASMRTLTMTYGLLLAAEQQGEIDPHSWARINDIVASSATAVILSRAGSDMPPLNVVLD